MEVSRLKINLFDLIFKRFSCKTKTELMKAKQKEDKIEMTPIKELPYAEPWPENPHRKINE